MSASKPDLRRCMGLLMALLLGGVAIGAPERDDEVIGQIREAWKSRRAAIKTFHYECELVEHVTKAAKPGGTDIFGDAPVGTPTIDVDLRSAIAFSCDQGKRAYRKDGQSWDEFRAVPKEYMFRATFDGVYKSLVQSISMPQGMIDRRAKPDSDLMALTHLTAFWLAFDPVAYFKARDYDAKKMRMGNRRVVRDGQEYLELRIPRSNPQWEGLLQVDPQRAYVPTQFKEVYQGDAVSKLDIQYVANDKVGWAVSAWRNQQLYPSGRPSSSAKAKVKRTIINSDLDDGYFALSFPPGCHLVEISDQGRKCFVQLEDGSLKEISESDFGRIGVK